MYDEFEEILNLSECLKDELIFLSEANNFKKIGYNLIVEDNQFFFIKNNKKISLLNLLKILEIN